MESPRIVGAGMAGCLAACLLPSSPILARERDETEIKRHRALLRFRNQDISNITGIPFEKVKVRKSIYANGLTLPSIFLANQYSLKVTESLQDRSIWDVQDEYRWVAPGDFQERLLEQVKNRVVWGADLSGPLTGPIISTAPLPATLDCYGYEHEEKFQSKEVEAWHGRIVLLPANIHQTIYFPLLDDGPVYRISIVGHRIIIEIIKGPGLKSLPNLKSLIHQSFGIPEKAIHLDGCPAQNPQGKLSPISDPVRKALISSLSVKHQVYSLGRYATWRPGLLLDDLPKDVDQIKKLISLDQYQRRLKA